MQELAFDYRFAKYPFERYKMPVVALYWLLPPDRDLGYSLRLLAREPSGEPLWEGLEKSPAAICCPPERWRPGEVVKLETRPISIARPWSDVATLPAM